MHVDKAANWLDKKSQNTEVYTEVTALITKGTLQDKMEKYKKAVYLSVNEENDCEYIFFLFSIYTRWIEGNLANQPVCIQL